MENYNTLSWEKRLLGGNMEELQCIKLRKNFKGLAIGTKGTIVLKYTENDFEVEFFDENNETIDVYTISKEYLEVFWTPEKGHIK